MGTKRENRKAATSKLEPGQNSIDRATPVERDGTLTLTWRYRPLDGSQPVRKRTQVPARTGKGELRRRAHATAAELLQASQDSTWKRSDLLTSYLSQVSRPKIDSADLRPNSRTRYLSVLDMLSDSMKGQTIASGTKFRALESSLQRIASEHGPESAHQARSVLSKYVLQQLIRDELLSGNPLHGVQLDLRGEHKGNGGKRVTGQALSRADYRRVLDYLLALDPAEGVEPPKRAGRWTLEDRVAVRRSAVDLTLLQAATGLRVTEATSLTWQDVQVDDSGQMFVSVSEAVSKTHRGRTVPVLDQDVAQRMLMRQNAAQSADAYVLGSPADETKRWDPRNRDRAVADLYRTLAAKLEIPMLESARSHLWRATLNSLMLDLPEAVRSAYFGHGAEANRQHYTDTTDVTGMVSAARHLRAVPEAV